jgi:2-oxo-4-hydroxy-4-carboxy-5-ureidoimidazoline decarboxylase
VESAGFGSGVGVPTEPHAVLGALPPSAAEKALLRCCGSTRWVARMLQQRPYASTPALFELADQVWSELEAKDYLEAFSHHPQIGADLAELERKFASIASWSASEQAGASGAELATLEALRDENRAYLERFGFIFIVCATGKSAAQMLELLRARLANDPATELRVAAGEQAKITKLRLEKLELPA